MIDPRTYSDILLPRGDGLWEASVEEEHLSYPAEGHAECLAVEQFSFWFQHRNRCLVELVRRYPPPGPIFDVGGGNGVVAKALVDAGFDAVVVEPGAGGAENALARGLRPVIRSSFEGAGFRQQSLPAVGVFDVIEHQQDDVAFLTEIASKVMPGGWVYATVPAHTWLWSADDEAAGHFRRYTRRSISAVFRAAALMPMFVSYFFSPLPPAIFLLRSLPSRVGRLGSCDAQRASREHSLPKGPIGWTLSRLLEWEWRIMKKRAVPIGASLLVAGVVRM